MDFVLNRLLLFCGLAMAIFGAGYAVKSAIPAKETSLKKEMDAYCASVLNDNYLSKLSPDSKKGLTAFTFFSPKLHTCVQVEVTLDPKDPGTMNYVVSDLTHNFVAPPNWHATDEPLHIVQTSYGSYHTVYAEGYWKAVSSDPGQQSAAQANRVKITCEYDAATRRGDANICSENQGYTQFGTIQTDHQTYHIASWSPDEVIATDVERGLSGSTTTTLLIHPNANEIEIIDRTNMDAKQPKLMDGMAGKSYGDHYELKGGMYVWNTEGVFFQCDEAGIITDMRFDVVESHHGDVVDLPESEWNAGTKANHKLSQQECETAMERKLRDLK